MKAIYQDKRWYQLQQSKEEGEAKSFEYLCDSGKIFYEFMIRAAGRINGIDYYDIVTSRGFGGPYIEYSTDVDVKNLIKGFKKEFNQFCRDNYIVAEYVKFDPWEDNVIYFSDDYLIEKHGSVCCNNLENDFYIREYSSKARNHIKQAIKNNIVITYDFTGDTIDSFLKNYRFTVNKYDASCYYQFDASFITKYFEILKGNVCILNAWYAHEIISSVLVVWGEDILHYHILGNNPQYKKYQANSLLMYNAALFARKMGKKIFDMGGSVEGSSVESFKRQFVKESGIIPYYTGKKVRNDKIYKLMVEQSGCTDNRYFPEYRNR